MQLPLLVAWPSKANNSGKVFVDARHKAHAVLNSMHIVGIMCNIMPGQEIKISKSKFALPHSTGCTRLWQRCVHYKRRNNTLSLPPTLSMWHRNLETWSCGESSEPSTAWQEEKGGIGGGRFGIRAKRVDSGLLWFLSHGVSNNAMANSFGHCPKSWEGRKLRGLGNFN